MKPSILYWSRLTAEERTSALRRPAQQAAESIRETVATIVADVRKRGDAALLEYTSKLDHANLASIEVTQAEFSTAEKALNSTQRAALQRAIDNVRRFHEATYVAFMKLNNVPQ
jgi:histidinol dehydrogenase